MNIFRLPDLGEGLQEAELVEWRVAAGESVKVDQPLVAVETAKAVVEIPSPQAGRIERLFAAAGDVIRIGAPLVGFRRRGARIRDRWSARFSTAPASFAISRSRSGTSAGRCGRRPR